MPLAIWMGNEQAGRQRSIDAGPRLAPDDAGLHLPAAADRAVLRHRRLRCGRRAPCSTRCRRSSGSPATASARCRRRRSRPPTRSGRRRWQRLTKVQLPMARKTIIVGINQTTMAALSMVTIAAYVNGPGPRAAGARGAADASRSARLRAWPADRDHGDHARPHHDRGERAHRAAAARRRRRPQAAADHAGWSQRSSVARLHLPLAHLHWAAEFPRDRHRRRSSPTRCNGFSDWFTDSFRGVTQGFKDLISRCCSTRCRTCWPSRRGGCPAIAPGPGLVLGGRRALAADGGLPGRHLLLRPVARHDDHAQHDPGRAPCW